MTTTDAAEGGALAGTRTICEMFARAAADHADRPAVRSSDGTICWTWSEYATRTRAAAAGFAGLGLGRGDTIAHWLTNRPEFHVSDSAAMLLGAVSFSVYGTYTVEQAEQVVGDADSRILVTEPAFLESALALRESDANTVEHVVLIDGEHASALTWAELLDCSPEQFDVDAAAAAVKPDDFVTLIYTSGTTGPPKGVQLTHANLCAQLETTGARLLLTEGLRAISWLPMAHVAERMCTHYFPMALGWEVVTCPDPRSVPALLSEVRPGFFFSPPRLWEKLRAGVLASLDDDTAAAVEAACDRVHTGDGPQDGPLQQAIRARLGFDELRVAIVGAAPCPAEVIEFWHSLGVPLGELYGMSESTGVATINPPDAIRIGTVGTALDGVEVRLSADGEVLMRGPVIMTGYRNLPDKTAETIDSDGWLHSGDVGEFDDDGYLRIVDRIKELIINAAGKNMSPANIEATVKTSSDLISQVCAIGDARPYNVALITLDPDTRGAFAERHGEDAIAAEVVAAVERANEQLARVEQIKKFEVLDQDWLPGGGELTPTMKLKRKPIAQRYADEIERLYR